MTIVIRVLLVFFMLFSQSLVADVSEDNYKEGVAAFNLGDIVLAMGKLETAMESGNDDAAMFLAFIYDKGEQDEKALALYRRLANRGHAAAKHKLGVMLVNGQGTETDIDGGLSLVREAVELGDSSAMFFLGTSYLSGKYGLENGQQQGLQLINQAVATGNSEAAKWLESYELKATTTAVE